MEGGLAAGAGGEADYTARLLIACPDRPGIVAAVSVALNTSAIYLGQFIGAFIGGFVLSHGLSTPPSEALPWVALPGFVLALWASLSAQRACPLPIPPKVVSS